MSDLTPFRSFADGPDAGDVHIPTTDMAGKPKGKNPTFLGKLYARLREMFADKDIITREQFEEAFRHARGHAGGKASPAQAAEDELLCPECGEPIDPDMDECPECGAALGEDEPDEDDAARAGEAKTPEINISINATGDPQSIADTIAREMKRHARAGEAANLADIAARGHTHRLFRAIRFAEAPEWIPYLPKPGTYTHPRYGEIVITKERNARFVQNFAARIYQDRLPVDAEHETKLSGAVGWITAMRQNADGSADAKVDWTDRGRAFFADDRFRYFSPEWYDAWQRPETGETIRDVAIGGALTTRPFFKDPALRPLFASEAGLIVDDDTQGDIMADQHSQSFAEMEAKITALQAENTALKTANEQTQAASVQLAEQVKKMAEEQQTQRFALLIKNDGVRWAGEDAKHLKVLRTLAQAFGEESDEFRSYVEQQRQVATALRQSGAFTELGGDGGGSQAETASTKIDRLARERAATDKIDYATALSKVAAEHADLYRQHMRESIKRED